MHTSRSDPARDGYPLYSFNPSDDCSACESRVLNFAGLCFGVYCFLITLSLLLNQSPGKMNQDIEKVKRVLENNRHELLGKENVVGAGIGYKVTGGEKTADLAIICSVVEKVKISSLSPVDRVPERIDDMPTDVVETGWLRAFQSPLERIRPAPGGVSIGHYAVTAGTLGCVVRRNGEKMILSNNHVLANSNTARIGDAVIQPGPYDGGNMFADQIATLEEFVPIHFEGEEPGNCAVGNMVAAILNSFAILFGRSTRFRVTKSQAFENKIDAAIARPINPDDIREEILTIGAIAGVGTAELDDNLQKMGRTTGFTLGNVDQIEASVKVNYGANQVALFTGQIIAGAMSAGGDSGSAVLNENKSLVGLLFAGSETTTIINPIEYVFNALNLTL
jgi:hypothetical protein